MSVDLHHHTMYVVDPNRVKECDQLADFAPEGKLSMTHICERITHSAHSRISKRNSRPLKPTPAVTAVPLISVGKPNARIAAAVAPTQPSSPPYHQAPVQTYSLPLFAASLSSLVMTLALSGSGASLRIETFPAALVRLNNASIALPKDLYVGRFNSSSNSPPKNDHATLPG